jgi:hypothetical protein
MPMVARRPWTLIVVVLIIDVALAVSGAWMLSQGLGDRQSAKATAPRGGDTSPPPAEAASATGAGRAASGSSSTPSK